MKKADFVIVTQPIDEIEINSVGIIKSTTQESAEVYFIGKSKNVTTSFDFLRSVDVKKTGDECEKKICNVCHILKPTTEAFTKNQNAKGDKPRRRPSCKVCRKIIDGKSITKPEEKRLNAERPADKTIFVCPICKKETVVGVTAKIVSDHDHGTGMGRKWICDSCNTGLGRFKDDVAILETAIEYLKQFADDESEESDSISQLSLDL